jgi:hypothetical protein
MFKLTVFEGDDLLGTAESLDELRELTHGAFERGASVFLQGDTPAGAVNGVYGRARTEFLLDLVSKTERLRELRLSKDYGNLAGTVVSSGRSGGGTVLLTMGLTALWGAVVCCVAVGVLAGIYQAYEASWAAVPVTWWDSDGPMLIGMFIIGGVILFVFAACGGTYDVLTNEEREQLSPYQQKMLEEQRLTRRAVESQSQMLGMGIAFHNTHHRR